MLPHVNGKYFMTYLPKTNVVCPCFLHGHMYLLFVTVCLNGCHGLSTERRSLCVPAETESKHPTEVPAGERGARSLPAQLLCLLQGETHPPAVSL